MFINTPMPFLVRYKMHLTEKNQKTKSKVGKHCFYIFNKGFNKVTLQYQYQYLFP